MRIITIAASLNRNSKSRVLGMEAHRALEARGVDADFLDLQDFPLPFAGTEGWWEDANAKAIAARIGAAQGIVLSAPVYNYDLSAAAKNLVELTGDAWEGKVVGFLCASGGPRSYMSTLGFANSLMLDYRCIILPRFVYTVNEDWQKLEIGNPEIKARILGFAQEMARLTYALGTQAPSPSAAAAPQTAPSTAGTKVSA
jgi:NAD(P)H-dependent FMN reductase